MILEEHEEHEEHGTPPDHGDSGQKTPKSAETDNSGKNSRKRIGVKKADSANRPKNVQVVGHNF